MKTSKNHYANLIANHLHLNQKYDIFSLLKIYFAKPNANIAVFFVSEPEQSTGSD
jgi:hypothetical protein